MVKLIPPEADMAYLRQGKPEYSSCIYEQSLARHLPLEEQRMKRREFLSSSTVGAAALFSSRSSLGLQAADARQGESSVTQPNSHPKLAPQLPG